MVLDHIVSRLETLPQFVSQNAKTIERFLKKNGLHWKGTHRDTVSEILDTIATKARHKRFITALDVAHPNEIIKYFEALDPDEQVAVVNLPTVGSKLLKLSLTHAITLPNLPESVWDTLTESNWAVILTDIQLPLLAKIPINKIPPRYPFRSIQPTWIHAALSGNMATFTFLVRHTPEPTIQNDDRSILRQAWAEHVHQLPWDSPGSGWLVYLFKRGGIGSASASAFSILDALLLGPVEMTTHLVQATRLDTHQESVDARTLAMTDCMLRHFSTECKRKPSGIEDAYSLIVTLDHRLMDLVQNGLINLTRPLSLVCSETQSPTYLMSVIESPLFYESTYESKNVDIKQILATWLVVLVRLLVKQSDWQTCPWTIGNLIYLNAAVMQVGCAESGLNHLLSQAVSDIKAAYRSPNECGFTPDIFDYFIERSSQLNSTTMCKTVLTDMVECVCLTNPDIQRQYNPISKALFHLPNTTRVIGRLLDQGLSIQNEAWTVSIAELVVQFAPHSVLDRLIDPRLLSSDLIGQIFETSRHNLLLNIIESASGLHTGDMGKIRRMNALIALANDSQKQAVLRQLINHAGKPV